MEELYIKSLHTRIFDVESFLDRLQHSSVNRCQLIALFLGGYGGISLKEILQSQSPDPEIVQAIFQHGCYPSSQ